MACSSHRVQTELLGLRMLDFVVGQHDRFFQRMSRNLFVLSNSAELAEQRTVSDGTFMLVYIDNEHMRFRVPNTTTCEVSPFLGLADIYPHLRDWHAAPQLRQQLCGASADTHVLSIRTRLGSEWDYVRSVFRSSTFFVERAKGGQTLLHRFAKVGACSLPREFYPEGCGEPCPLETTLESQLRSLQRFLNC